MAEFTLDISKFKRAINNAPQKVGKGATRAMGDIKDDWVRGSRDIAPLENRNLRDNINGEVKLDGRLPYVEIESNAYADTGGRRFNYAYYIHEGYMRADGKSLRTPGTVEKYLEESIDKRKAEYKQWLIDEIKSELKGGW